jgi:ribosome-binding protein aMBF1 (putative translation factor)
METMIKNDRQYRITKAQAQKLEKALASTGKRADTKSVHPVLHRAQSDALRSQLADLRVEIKEYEALRSGKQTVLAFRSFDDLPRTLIQARIASGLSQKDLADRLGVKEQQIQRYEATEYSTASLARVCDVARALGLKVKVEASVA